MFRVPYRWMPRTIWANLRSMWQDVHHGVYNIFRWLPIIWFDQDWDWCYLARIMEYKMRRMSRVIAGGMHVGREKDARDLLVCAELLRRMQDDRYFEQAGYNPKTWSRQMDYHQSWMAKHAHSMLKQDQRYLGLLIGKYLTHWWD